jgi:hypothetical protein
VSSSIIMAVSMASTIVTVAMPMVFMATSIMGMMMCRRKLRRSHLYRLLMLLIVCSPGGGGVF